MPIRKLTNGKWKIDNTPGTCDTREECVKRLQAIKASKSSKMKRVSKEETEDFTKEVYE